MRHFGVILFFFLLTVSPVYAVTVSLSTPSASIDQDQELSLSIFLSCASCGDSYLRGVFSETSDNYFGFTQNNGGEWIGTSSDRTKYFKVSKDDVKDSTWGGIIKFKVDKDSSFYKGPGNYSLKVGRYTASIGSSATWSDSFLLSITGPAPTIAPTSSAPTSTPAPTNTPTNSPIPTVTPTFIPTKTPTRRPNPTVTPSDTPTPEASHSGEVLSLTDPVSFTPAATPSGTLKPLIISFALIGAGLGILSLLLLWQKRDLFTRPKGPDDIISS